MSSTDEAKKTSSPQSLRDIQANELALEHAQRQPTSIPFHLLQLEERAIRELEEYYMAIYEDDTPAFFVVKRKNKLSNVNEIQSFDTDGLQQMKLASPNKN